MERIEGFNYFVDEDGHIWNKRMRMLRPRLNNHGYPQVRLVREDGVIIQKLIHIIVMETFVGPKPKGCDVDHINYDRTDNRLENLRYVTTHWNRGEGRRNCIGKEFNPAEGYDQMLSLPSK